MSSSNDSILFKNQFSCGGSNFIWSSHPHLIEELTEGNGIIDVNKSDQISFPRNFVDDFDSIPSGNF